MGGKKNRKKKTYDPTELSTVAERLRVPPGPVQLSELPTGVLDFGPQSKAEAAEAMLIIGPRLAGLQERLYAQATRGDRRSLLLILQGMDTAGKDGVTNHVVGQVNPGGLELASFKAPTAEELSHDFLWRIRKRVPAAGRIGVFNRSHYEDVLIVRVHDLVPKEVWSRRYAAINAFERELVRRGVTVVKCFTHVSKEVQRERLLARLDDPTKHWKYNPGDLAERARWADYRAAYQIALERNNTVGAPWYVIPADKKWYRNWLVAALLEEKLASIDPQYPPADFDIEVERRRLAET
jgi:PPK2 family polyphosphate:nucleotide phosphotransferase